MCANQARKYVERAFRQKRGLRRAWRRMRLLDDEMPQLAEDSWLALGPYSRAYTRGVSESATSQPDPLTAPGPDSETFDPEHESGSGDESSEAGMAPLDAIAAITRAAGAAMDASSVVKSIQLAVDSASVMKSLGPLMGTSSLSRSFALASGTTSTVGSASLAALSNTLVYNLVDLRDPVRAARIVGLRDLREGLDSARAAGLSGISVDATLRVVAGPLAREPIPTLPDGLLTDNLDDVQSWVSQVMAAILQASGLSERDLLEDAVAGWVYTMTFCMVLALLVQFPFMATIAGLTGALPAHGTARVASKLARRGLRTLEEI